MKFEQPENNEHIYEGEGLAGPSRDFSRMRGSSRREILTSEVSENNKAKDLYNAVVSIIDTDHYSMTGSHPEDIMDMIGLVARENDWKTYDDINFDMIRKELELNDVPLRPRKKPQQDS